MESEEWNKLHCPFHVPDKVLPASEGCEEELRNQEE